MLNPIKYTKKLQKLEGNDQKYSKSQDNFRAKQKKSQEIERDRKMNKSISQQRLTEQQMDKIRNKYMFNTMKDKYDVQINKKYRKD